MSVNIYENINNQIGFEVHAPQILGSGFGNVKLLGIMDYDSARISANIDPAAMHLAVYPFLPSGSTPNDHRKYSYAKIQMANGDVTAIGIPWINMATLTVINTRSYNLLVANVPPAEVEEMAKILIARGFNVVSTTPIEAG